jgi:hypothetical protein
VPKGRQRPDTITPSTVAFDEGVEDITQNAEILLSSEPFEVVADQQFQKPNNGKLLFGYSHKTGWIN